MKYTVAAVAALLVGLSASGMDTVIGGNKIVADQKDAEHITLKVGSLTLTRDEAKELARFISYSSSKVRPVGYAEFQRRQQALKDAWKNGQLGK